MRRTLLVTVALAVLLAAAPADAAKKAKVPGACLSAIADSRSMAALMVEQGQAQTAFFAASSASAAKNASLGAAGVASFLSDLTAATNAFSTKTDSVAARLAPVRSAFETHAAACERGK